MSARRRVEGRKTSFQDALARAMAHRYAAGDESPVTPPQNTRTFDMPSPYATAAMKLRDNDENEHFARGGNTSSSAKRATTTTTTTTHALTTASDAPSPVPVMDSIWNIDHVSVKTSALSGSVRALSDVGRRAGEPPAAPQPGPPTYAPKGVDEHSYLLGQNDALLAAFEGALPQRQLLGALQLALADVREHVARLESSREGANENVARLGARIGTLGGRSRVLENNIRDLTLSTLPAIERQIGALQARMDVAERRRSMSWRELLAEAAKTTLIGVSTKVSDAERVAGKCARQFLFNDDGCATLDVYARRTRTSALEKNIGAAMFVAAVEALCAANAAVHAKLPARFQNRATVTFTKGIEISRTVVWASVFIHAATSIKDETARAASMLCAAFGTNSRDEDDDVKDDTDENAHVAGVCDAT